MTQRSLIICDEAHNIVVFPNYSPQPNFASIARDAIYKAAANPAIMVVGITATPEPLEKLRCPIYQVPIDASELRQYENHSLRYYSSLRYTLENIRCGKIGMLYVPRITMMKECATIAAAAGHHPICVWSAANEDHPVDESQKVVTESRKVAAVCDKRKKNGNTVLQEGGWTRKIVKQMQ